MRVFLGITGASGAPYAARLVDSLAAAGCEVGVCASAAGIQVLATELYGDQHLPRDEVLARFVERAGDAVTVYDPHDYTAPYASGSARVDGYVVCPCSMATAGTIATGGEANLIHRAAGVALKEERKLVLVPRETPLSTIHLENLLTLRRAGATILFAAPGFYHGASGSHAPAEPEHALGGGASARLGIDDLVDFIVARCLAQLGLDQSLVQEWGT
jgi:flavin prenyltransferase